MTCPDCDLHKIRAAMWRNKAYELNGTPLPWNAEELIEKAVLAEREECARVCEQEALLWPPPRDFALCAAAIRARSKE